MGNLLEVKGVSKIFRIGGMLRGKKLVAVDNVSFTITDDKPVILSIVGESGCGKSTLCKMILRLHRPDMGDIVLDGQSYLDKKYDHRRFKLEVQPIFQNPYESFSARKRWTPICTTPPCALALPRTRKRPPSWWTNP